MAFLFIGGHVKEVEVVCKECYVILKEGNRFVAFLVGGERKFSGGENFCIKVNKIPCHGLEN